MAEAHLARQKKNNVASSPLSATRHIAAHRGWLLWAVGALALAVMSALAHGAAQFPGDTAVSALLQRLHGTAIAPFVNFPSDANQPQPGGVIALTIVLVFAVLRRVIEAVAVAVTTFGTDLINAIINSLVARPRPHGVHVTTLSGLGAHSFPSGHVEHVTVLFGFLFFLTLLIRRAHPERWAWLLPVQIICVYFIALVGVGRIVEGTHQPSDVLAGYLVAALALPLGILFYRWMSGRWQRHRRHKALMRLLQSHQGEGSQGASR